VRIVASDPLFPLGSLQVQKKLEIRIKVREELLFDKMSVQRELLAQLACKSEIAHGIGVRPRVKLVEPGSISGGPRPHLWSLIYGREIVSM
jgi:hypothetical protein